MELIWRVGFLDKVEFRVGDLLNYDWEGIFDYFIFFLVFLYVLDWIKVLVYCYKVLKFGGWFFIEDFVVCNFFSSGEVWQLKEMVSV